MDDESSGKPPEPEYPTINPTISPPPPLHTSNLSHSSSPHISIETLDQRSVATAGAVKRLDVLTAKRLSQEIKEGIESVRSKFLSKRK